MFCLIKSHTPPTRSVIDLLRGSETNFQRNNINLENVAHTYCLAIKSIMKLTLFGCPVKLKLDIDVSNFQVFLIQIKYVILCTINFFSIYT